MSGVHGNGARFTMANGCEVYYEVEGDAPEATLIFSGGPGVSHAHYHPWFSALAEATRVIYFDYPGVGRSGRVLETYTVTLYAEAASELLEHLDVSSANIIGVSFGGIPALQFAAEHENRVRRLVLSNAQLSGRTWQATNIDNVNRELREQFPDVWRAILELREAGARSLDSRYQELVEVALPAMEWADARNHPPLARPDPEESFNVDVYRSFCGEDPEWLLDGSLRGYEPGSSIARLRVPTLIITGRFDRLTPPYVAHEIKAALEAAPVSLVTLEESAHRPWVEQPVEYFSTVADFLTRE